ncbi:MAG: ABC transporter permease [Tissierellia bacterium]|nr:ABC transporter permease [Tissierellia bacterium]
MTAVKDLYKKIGFPRLIITLFLVVLLVLSYTLKIEQGGLWTSILERFGMNAIMVLAMVPAIQSGTGINFNLALGVVMGLIGALVALELNLTGWICFFVALAIAIPLAIIAGWLYGKMLNRVKGQEMTVGNYVGFSVVSFMCIIWLIAPFKNESLVWAMGGTGLRTTLTMEDSMARILNDALAFNIGSVRIPTGLLLFVAICTGLMYFFLRTKSGNSLSVAGSNANFARSNGINVDRQRLIGTIISTVCAAIGIIVYSQSFGFLQLYTAPLYVALPAAAAILIGGASMQKAKIIHVIIGTFLFQSLLVVALPVVNIVSEGSMAEIVRIVVSNGIIVYALTRGGDES